MAMTTVLIASSASMAPTSVAASAKPALLPWEAPLMPPLVTRVCSWAPGGPEGRDQHPRGVVARADERHHRLRGVEGLPGQHDPRGVPLRRDRCGTRSSMPSTSDAVLNVS